MFLAVFCQIIYVYYERLLHMKLRMVYIVTRFKSKLGFQPNIAIALQSSAMVMICRLSVACDASVL